MALQKNPPQKFIVLSAARVVKRFTDLVLDTTDLADLLFLTQRYLMHAKRQINEQLHLEKTISVIILFLIAISDNTCSFQTI